MKTWEMIKELEKDSSKIFENSPGNRVGFDGLYLTWEISGQQFVISSSCFFTDWKEVKQPVSFMEAFKALRSDCKNIYCMNDKSRFDFMGERFGSHVFDEDLIGQGKWYIED